MSVSLAKSHTEAGRAGLLSDRPTLDVAPNLELTGNATRHIFEYMKVATIHEVYKAIDCKPLILL